MYRGPKFCISNGTQQIEVATVDDLIAVLDTEGRRTTVKDIHGVEYMNKVKAMCYGCNKGYALNPPLPVNKDGSPTLYKCGACENITYCSKECQKKDWRRHKPQCKKAAASKADYKKAAASKADYKSLKNKQQPT